MSEKGTSIVERVAEESRARAESILSTARRVAQREVHSAERRARTRQRVAQRELDEQVAARRVQAEAEARFQSRKRKLRRRHELAGQLIARSLEQLAAEPRDEDYLQLLTRLAAEAARSLGVDRVEVLVSPSDREFLDAEGRFERLAASASQEAGASLLLADETVETSGGLVARTGDRRVYFYNTFEEKAQRLGPRLREDITQELFGTEP